MKIDRSLSQVASTEYTRARSLARSEDKSVSKERGERVEISEGSRLLVEARAPEQADLEKVERIRAALADGSFSVDPEKIADRMLEEEW